jgi:uncharacterized membrane protein
MMAGLNHFLSTEVYYGIMPKWLPCPIFLIYLSGLIEIILGVLLLFRKSRKFGALLIILMLVTFLPIHIYMIELAPFILGKIHVTPLIAWARLAFQFVFIGWTWYYYKK